MPASLRPALEGKVVLVTGAGTGIGAAICLAAAREGADIALCYHASREGAMAVCDEVIALGVNAFTIPADLRNGAATRSMVESVIAKMGKVDVVVNNAAVVHRSSLLEIPETAWEETFAVNLRAALLCTQVAARSMIACGIRGRIINISSVGGLLAHDDLCAYDASKAGMLALTRCAARELARHGITVNAVVPGAIEVARTQGEFAGVESADRWQDIIPVGHRGNPDDVARAVLFLAAEEAAFITGQAFVVDGGQTITLSQP
jgi:NAD(P)-dependent dehydrogenase (short-subunit alcohol dehydrogenase family)